MSTENPKQVDGEVIEQDEPSWSERILSADHWIRVVYMILFALILGVVAYIIPVLVFIQFLWGLITGEGNKRLREFGSSLSQFVYQALRFLTYNTDEKPYPFADWPDSEKSED